MKIINEFVVFEEKFKKYNEIKEALTRERNELLHQIEIEKNLEKNRLEELEELTKCFKSLNDEIYQIETNIEIEKLRKKTCSDETKNSLNILYENIDYVRDLYSKKNEILLEEFNIDVKFSKKTNCIKIKFLANDQEILLKVMSPSKFIASYETCVDEIIVNDKKAEMDKLISKFNKREKQIVKDFVQTMRYFFSN